MLDEMEKMINNFFFFANCPNYARIATDIATRR